MFKFMLSSDLDQVEFFDIFDPNRIVAIVKRIRRRLNEFQNFLFEGVEAQFGRPTSNLFHLIVVDGKKEFLKEERLVLKQKMLSEFEGE